MREGSLSWLYTAWLIIISLAIIINDVKSAPPTSGATITKILTLTSTSLEVTWDAVSSTNETITGYTVCYQLSSSVTCSGVNKTVDGNTTTAVITGLEIFTKYYVAVLASSASGNGQLGAEIEGMTGEDTPNKGPEITTINATSSTSINVTWGEVPAEDTNGNITHYFVCYKVQTSQDDICSVKRKFDNVNNRSTVLDNLNEFTTYDVAIQAANSKGAGPPGGIKNVTTFQDNPAKGPNITNITPSSTRLQVTWEKLGVDDANGEITNYEVCYQLGSTGPDCTTSKNVTGGDNTTTDLTGLKPATMYTVAVRAFTTFGAGPPGESKRAKTNESAPAKGATVTMVNPISSTELEVTWEKLQGNGTNGNIIGYRICYETQQLSRDSCTNYADVVGTNNTSFNLTGLNEATTYFVAVQAGTRAGFGPNGNNLTGKTLEDKPARGPDIKSISATSSKSLRVEWNKIPNPNDENGVITKYSVCYKPMKSSGDICGLEKIVGNVLRATLADLMEDTPYVVAVKAATMVGFGPPGANRTARTHEDMPQSGPEIITISATSSTSIEVTWGKVIADDTNGDITHYFVCYKVQTSQYDICSATKRVDGVNNRNTVLDNLNEFTTYDVAIQAATSKGVRPHGGIKSVTTFQDIPSGPPLNINLTERSVSSLSFTWDPPEQNKRNGIIIGYTVCVSRSHNQPCFKMYTTNDQDIVVSNLNASTKYYVRFRGSTAAGSGNYSEFKGFFTNGKAVEKATTGTSSTLSFTLKIPSGRFNYIYVVALKIIEGKQPKSPGCYRNNELVTYTEAEKSTEPRPYIASVFSASDLESNMFVLGDGKNRTYSKGRKRRSLTSEFYNGPLEGGSSYRIFQRVFVDDKGDYYSTEWSPASKTNDYQGQPQVLTNISSGDVMAKIGDHVNLLCAAEGEPPISFRWEKAKTAIESFFETDKPYHSSLLVLKVKDLSSFGKYTCHIRDRFSTVSHTIRIWNIDAEENSDVGKGYLVGVIVIAIILAILLVLVVYFVCQNRALKAASSTKKTLGNKGTRNTTMTDVIYEQPDNTTGKTDNENYEELENCDATYTALNRTGKEDEDHFYSHLNEMQEKDTGI